MSGKRHKLLACWTCPRHVLSIERSTLLGAEGGVGRGLEYTEVFTLVDVQFPLRLSHPTTFLPTLTARSGVRVPRGLPLKRGKERQLEIKVIIAGRLLWETSVGTLYYSHVIAPIFWSIAFSLYFCLVFAGATK